MYLVQLLLPLYDDAGRHLSQALFAEVRDELTQRYGGVTAFFSSPAEGTWKEESGTVDVDQIVMCEVMVETLDRSWWGGYRRTLEARFGQRELVVRALLLERL